MSGGFLADCARENMDFFDSFRCSLEILNLLFMVVFKPSNRSDMKCLKKP